MKTLGIIGGIAPESTIDYYRTIIALYRARKPDGSYPPILINSIDLQRVLATVGAGQLDALADWMVAELEKLARAGADFAIMASNTPHIVFDEVALKSPIPLISIVEAACSYVKERSLKRLALFGTRYTMQADFYQKVFSREKIDIVVPDPKDQDYIHEKYFAELVPGIFLPETRAGLLAIIDRMKAGNDIDGVILAGTEIPLILRGESHNGAALLDTGKIHCAAAVAEMLK